MGSTTVQTAPSSTLPPHAIIEAFARAIDCASAFVGATAPNPPVGCVLLDQDGHPLAAAAHPRAGEGHAEARAIEAATAAGVAERIHTVVVTLEPCNHRGRTPPCTEAILATNSREVWIGAPDPNPSVKGGGAARLAQAGLRIAFACDIPGADGTATAAQAERLIAPFAKRVRTGLPWITVKQALDRTGSMIPPRGAKTFTSEASLRLAHALRKRADAILTGSGTVLADRPEFTVRRIPDFPARRRTLVVLDRRALVPDCYLEAAQARGFEVWRAGSAEEALERLGTAGALEVLVEAGPALSGDLLERGLWDEHVVIAQGEPGAEDTVTIRGKARGGADVFRHH